MVHERRCGGGADDLVVDGKRKRKRKSHVVLTEEEIHQRLGEEVAATAEVFCVPADWALALLVHYGWNPLRLHEEWFAEQDRIRDAVGLGDAATVPGDEIVTCGICAEAKPAEEMASAGCAHYYCHDCWRGYVAAALDDGGGAAARCFSLRCPDPSCSRAVLRGMAEGFATPAARDAYARALARAYVAARHRRLKPCTAPGCGCAIELSPAPRDGAGEDDDGDLECRCGNAFCWRCGGAPHWPAGCAAAARWARDADEATAAWVLLHTKPCPRCRRLIERFDGGCDDMVCAAPCGHRFCWGCLAPTPATTPANEWLTCEHVERRPTESKAEKEKKALARVALDSFIYYQDMWMDNLRERRNAEAELRKLHDERLPGARDEERETLEAVAAAWEVVAEGRRVLGNACAHGKWLREADAARWKLFEFQHDETDIMLERLQDLAKKVAAPWWKSLEAFSDDLAELTRAARRGIENFTKVVEDGMPEVGASASSGKSSGTQEIGRCSVDP